MSWNHLSSWTTGCGKFLRLWPMHSAYSCRSSNDHRRVRKYVGGPAALGSNALGIVTCDKRSTSPSIRCPDVVSNRRAKGKINYRTLATGGVALHAIPFLKTEAAWVRGRQHLLLRWTTNIGYRGRKTAAHPYHR